jgi:hypothetical protein
MFAAGQDQGVFMARECSAPQFNGAKPFEIAIIQHPILCAGQASLTIRAKPPFIARAIMKAAPGSSAL